MNNPYGTDSAARISLWLIPVELLRTNLPIVRVPLKGLVQLGTWYIIVVLQNTAKEHH